MLEVNRSEVNQEMEDHSVPSSSPICDPSRDTTLSLKAPTQRNLDGGNSRLSVGPQPIIDLESPKRAVALSDGSKVETMDNKELIGGKSTRRSERKRARAREEARKRDEWAWMYIYPMVAFVCYGVSVGIYFLILSHKFEESKCKSSLQATYKASGVIHIIAVFWTVCVLRNIPSMCQMNSEAIQHSMAFAACVVGVVLAICTYALHGIRCMCRGRGSRNLHICDF
ncbi:hypothetical protein AAMO2058_001196700 [Amorphochlora amoebiformis]